MKKIFRIKDIYSKINFFFWRNKKINFSKKVKVGGWVKYIRKNKEITFIKINDGSTAENLQLIFKNSELFSKISKKIKKINFGSSILVEGEIIITYNCEQICEIKIEKIISLKLTESNYPLQKKNIPLNVIRNYPHLRIKTNYFLIIFQLRSFIIKTIHDFFYKEKFYYISTPIITNNDSEGGGETFNLKNKKKINLTVSGQLEIESMVQGLGKVYNFSPCFRAEKFNTTKHLSEFWMIEAEITFIDLEFLINFVEKFIKNIIKITLEKKRKKLFFLENYGEKKKEIINKLEKIVKNKFKKINYYEAIEILKKEKKFSNSQILKENIKINSENEKFLCDYFENIPVFITNYPKEIKAFYMKENNDKKTVSCFDLIFPKIGELVGGSIREDSYKIMKEKMRKKNISINSLKWYLDLRKFGYLPSGGFGIGFERLLMFISDCDNIYDSIAYPFFNK